MTSKLSAHLTVPILSLCMLAAPEGHGQEPPPASCEPPYQFRADHYTARLAAAADVAERARLLAERWELIKQAVSYCDALMEGPFSRVSMEWAMPGMTRPHVVKGDLTDQVEVVRESIVIQGDCIADLTTDADTIYIHGDLRGTLRVGEMTEIIIAGNVADGAAIVSADITSVFVGGHLVGAIEASSSLTAWIDGDLTGRIRTGTPSARLHVMGDYRGEISPLQEAALLSVNVRGFATSASVRKIALHHYTEFVASVGVSDDKPGLHHGPGPMSLMMRWVIHERRDE